MLEGPVAGHVQRPLHDIKSVVEPALDALSDPRLAGARSKFEAALSHLRSGTLKDREDAVEEAAKSVESAINVLISETGTLLTNSATAQNMFGALKAGGIVPAYTEAALLGAARSRNKIGGHGAGAQARRIDIDEATITVSAAAGSGVSGREAPVTGRRSSPHPRIAQCGRVEPGELGQILRVDLEVGD